MPPDAIGGKNPLFDRENHCSEACLGKICSGELWLEGFGVEFIADVAARGLCASVNLVFVVDRMHVVDLRRSKGNAVRLDVALHVSVGCGAATERIQDIMRAEKVVFCVESLRIGQAGRSRLRRCCLNFCCKLISPSKLDMASMPVLGRK
jgi:hypothetical protein